MFYQSINSDLDCNDVFQAALGQEMLLLVDYWKDDAFGFSCGYYGFRKSNE